MTFRFYNPAPVLHDLLGLEPCAGGTLAFFDRGTTTPRMTWADADKAVPNPNPVPLDSSGRVNNNVWLDGAYSVVLKNAAGATVWTRDVDSGSGAGQAIPALVTGEFLTNDGSNLAWAPVLEVPDPTGAEGHVLTVASGLPAWVPPAEPPVIPDPDIVIGTAPPSFRAGVSDSTTKILHQYGTGSAPASGARTTNAAISFPVPFDKIFCVMATPKQNVVGAHGIGATCAITGYTQGAASSGCTVNFNSADDGGDSGYQIINAIPFDWVAIGTVQVTG